MSGEPNINVIAAQVIQAQISNAIGAVSRGIRASIGAILQGASKDLNRYTESKIRKCSYIKTPIINRDRSTFIGDIYVQTRLKVRNQSRLDDDFIANLNGNDSIVIAGNAGSGKSMLMRHLFLCLCSAKNSKIPLFFELRDLNGADKKDLKEFLYYNLIGANATITYSQFVDSLKAGVFSLVLDGFDEINFDDRQNIELQIRRLREECPELQMIISTRPDADRRFESWQAFETVHVEPMREAQATELIKKLDYDTKVKSKFLKEAKERLFKSHGTFLSNPLLCIMMLVTFEQTGHIPTKRHVFFEKAFDALFSIHDTAKEGVYKRKTYSNLSVDEFRNCMSAFCMVTYLKEQFAFSRVQIRESLKQSLELEGLDIGIDDLISDMIESTCLIQVEGTEYTFTHRSFQEYFAALYISRSPAVGVAKLLDSVVRRGSDDVIPLAYSINRGLIEREWIIPALQRFLDDPKFIVQENIFIFIREYVGGLMLTGDRQGRASLHFFFTGNGIHLFRIFSLYTANMLEASLLFNALQESSRAERERVVEAYRQLLENGDGRLAPRPKKSAKRKGKATSEPREAIVSLDEKDLNWLKGTGIVRVLTKMRSRVETILSECKASAQAQEDILDQLSKSIKRKKAAGDVIS